MLQTLTCIRMHTRTHKMCAHVLPSRNQFITMKSDAVGIKRFAIVAGSPPGVEVEHMDLRSDTVGAAHWAAAQCVSARCTAAQSAGAQCAVEYVE